MPVRQATVQPQAPHPPGLGQRHQGDQAEEDERAEVVGLAQIAHRPARQA